MRAAGDRDAIHLPTQTVGENMTRCGVPTRVVQWVRADREWPAHPDHCETCFSGRGAAPKSEWTVEWESGVATVESLPVGAGDGERAARAALLERMAADLRSGALAPEDAGDQPVSLRLTEPTGSTQTDGDGRAGDCRPCALGRAGLRYPGARRELAPDEYLD